MNINKILLAFLLVLGGLQCQAQNLIANGSFEDVNTCTEANAECSPEAWKTTSPFLLTYLGDPSNRFVGFTVFNPSVPNTRQYLQIKLLCPLLKDITYKFTFRLKSFDLRIESIGALFSDSIIFFNKDILINIKPTIDFSNQILNIPKRKRLDWNQIEVTYKAGGFEKYLVIGNFQTDTEQRRIFTDKPKNFTNYLYGIDNIELVPIDKIEMCPEYEETKEILYNLNDRHPLRRFNLFGDDEKKELNEVIEELKVDTITVGNVLFKFDSFELTNNGIAQLDSLFKKINKETIESIRILGYTDSIGGQQYNLRLSLNRAKTIKEFLSSKKLDSLINEIKGYGDKFPIDNNSTETGRQNNRRVEVILKYK
jgi:outer membrane protein OmpA-like peptidoglycan-associated protein